MKTLTVHVPKKQLSEILTGAHPGDMIVLTDGERSVAMEQSAALPFDPEEDSPGLEAELLKAIDGPFTPYSAEEMRAIGERIIREKKGK